MWVCQRKSSHSQNRSELHLILLSSCSSRVLQCFRDLFAATFQKFWVKVYYELTEITLPVVNKVYLYPMRKIEETFVFISYAENRGDIHFLQSVNELVVDEVKEGVKILCILPKHDFFAFCGLFLEQPLLYAKERDLDQANRQWSFGLIFPISDLLFWVSACLVWKS